MRNRRRGRKNARKATTNALAGERSAAFAAKHSSFNVAQQTTTGATQAHLWDALEDATVYTQSRASSDRCRNVYDARRRYESESFRDLDTSVAIVWDTNARKRAESRRGVSFITPERRVAGHLAMTPKQIKPDPRVIYDRRWNNFLARLAPDEEK
jgi:hypothetical protein